MHKKTLSKEFVDKWQHLLEEVEMDDVPLEYIERLELHFNDGHPPAFIDIESMMAGNPGWKIERTISEHLESIDDKIERVDFHLNLEKVVDVVDTATEELLKDI